MVITVKAYQKATAISQRKLLQDRDWKEALLASAPVIIKMLISPEWK